MRMKNRGQGSGVRDQGSGVRGQGSERAEYPSLSTIHYPLSTAFTLVELLVVIVIISMLVGLLMPALIAARGRARIAQCTNNQHELSTAIQGFDMAKKRLPGYLNQVRGTTVISWVPMLFPYLGRMDLWEGIPNSSYTPPYDGWRYGTPITEPVTTTMRVHIDQLVCPDDADASVVYPLTYVLNLGLYGTAPTPSDLGLTSPGVFRDYSGGTNNAISLPNVKSTSQTIMFSEKSSSAIPLNPGRQWTDDPVNLGLTPAQMQAQLGFSWPDPSIPAFANITVSNSLRPIHPGIVIVTFCDGHTESLSDDTLCSDYLAVP